MSNTTETMVGRGNIMPAQLGSKFIRGGLALFLLGFVTGFIPILHYMVGAVAGNVGPAFLKNITLWWGCPAILMEYALKAGGLGMVAIGLCYLVFPRAGRTTPLSAGERAAPLLCVGGLVGAFVYAAVGYVVFNSVWPNFYFEPVDMGKNVWLAGQGIGIALYVLGIWFAVGGIWGHLVSPDAAVEATPAHAGR